MNDAALGDTVRWGVIGTGGIATDFAHEVAMLDDATIVAVGSRTQESADRYATEHSIGHAHSSYADLVADDDVEVVYVATPHPGHHDAAMLAIEAGKSVLVEKAFTMNAAEAQSLVSAARSRGVFLMEAMWTRFLPRIVRIRELVAQGAVGQVTQVMADHGQWFPHNPAHRLFDPALGGGALLDLGVYPVSFASMVLGTPTSVTAISEPAFTGVDATTSILLTHTGGAHAVLTCTSTAVAPTRGAIVGTEGLIEIPGAFYAAPSFRLTRRDGADEVSEEPMVGKGLRYEIAEVGRCLREGRLESPSMPLDETVAIMATMDEVRRQIGLTYPLG